MEYRGQMMYGGALEIEKVDVCEADGEHQSITKKYLAEIFNMRDEYQSMFEEYFQVSSERYLSLYIP